jgi:CO/xanthine dehydrogenase FAD-binding subunit
MKPAPFHYHDPGTIEEAIELLCEYGEDARVLAGGQSLVPMMNFRLAQPDHLVDLRRITSLDHVTVRHGRLHVGAMTRQSVLESSAEVRSEWPLLSDALRFVAHPQIRNRGTVGGSVAHADPVAELPAALAALDAQFILRSKRGERTVGWRGFFVTHLTTAIAHDELLVEIEVPVPPLGAKAGFSELARRHRDFALAGAAVVVCCSGDACEHACVALLGAGDKPVRAHDAERHLVKYGMATDSVTEAARLATTDLEPVADIHATSNYRRHLLEVMVKRAIALARNQHPSRRSI